MKSLRAICVMMGLLAGGSANAQTRHPRGTTTPATSTTPANPYAAPQPASNTTAAAAPEPAPAAAHTSSASHPSHEPSQVLVSNVIDRPNIHSSRVEAEIFAGVGPGAWAWPWGGFVLSPGVRLAFPLTRNGPIATMNNDFRLVIGAQIYFSVTPDFYWWVSAPVTLQWNFYLSDQWSVLLEAGLAVDVYTYDYLNCYDHPQLYCDRVFFHPAGAFGLRRHLGSSNIPGPPSISFRFTYPGGVQVALGF